jgi:hypothetical protein
VTILSRTHSSSFSSWCLFFLFLLLTVGELWWYARTFFFIPFCAFLFFRTLSVPFFTAEHRLQNTVVRAVVFPTFGIIWMRFRHAIKSHVTHADHASCTFGLLAPRAPPIVFFNRHQQCHCVPQPMTAPIPTSSCQRLARGLHQPMASNIVATHLPSSFFCHHVRVFLRLHPLSCNQLLFL